MPYHLRQEAAELKAKVGVPSIPYLCILSDDGKILTLNGRKSVSSDPEGKLFPWKEEGAEGSGGGGCSLM